jgi:7-carboxy-7-deazaguanine synthase
VFPEVIMSYLVNDIFYTLQGEGFWTGRPAVFVRFARCNLWNGREEDRHRAVCQFCDTDFLKGERYTFADLIGSIDQTWQGEGGQRMAVLTGGEPTLQVNTEFVEALHEFGFYVAIETNGTRPVPDDIDWICVSPKGGAPVSQRTANEMKLVYPQSDMPPDLAFSLIDALHYWISPMDGPNLAQNTQDAIEYVLRNPQWRLNVQTHKVIGVK